MEEFHGKSAISKKGYGCKWKHERLSIITQIKVKEQRFSCGSTFYSHSKVLSNDNENNYYAKMSVKRPLAYS